MGALGRWRAARHLRACPECRTQAAAQLELAARLPAALEPAAAEAAATRVTEQWVAALTASRPQPARRPLPRRWLTASATLACAAALFVFSSVTAPSRAMGAVSHAMARVQRFHVSMEVPGMDLRYEAWGERDRAARVEERQGGVVTQVLLDDGRRLRSYDPTAGEISQGRTRLKRFFRQTLGFSATRVLRRAAQGKLFEGQEWLGEARAREVARIRREGVLQRRVQVDLKDGFFARMVLYAEVKGDRVTQANLYLDADTPDAEPSARVRFDYPEKLDPSLFVLNPPKGTQIRNEPLELTFPEP
jgi:hypothetical protein